MIPQDVMRAIRRIEIRTNRLVDRGLGGEYHSVFKGQGMEFSEVREYQPGDDVRSIDWNVSSRTGELHVKKFVEERELTVLLAVDVSRSGDFGSIARTKLETSAEVAAMLAFAAVRNNDRVGLLLFTDRVEHHIPAAKGGQHALRVVRDVLCHEPRGRGTDIASALSLIVRSERRRAVVFLLSDFLDHGYEFALRVAARAHDVVGACVTDPREDELPAAGLLSLEDSETGRRALVDAGDPAVRERFRSCRRAYRERTVATLRRCGVDLLRLSTQGAHDVALMRFFRMRERRAQHG